MRHIDVQIHAAGLNAADVYARLCDFERYTEFACAVKSVRVTAAGNGTTTSRWEVLFRTGILRWTEEDRFDADARTIHFRQTEGDIDYFSGTWVVREDTNGNSVVQFSADFDLGIPTLASILEPIAERALRDNIQQIGAGLLRAASTADRAAAAD
jgi:ribosome-associated toxin RatA of RatAB toxin-antitoxin module